MNPCMICDEPATDAIGIMFTWETATQNRTRAHARECCSAHHAETKNQMSAGLQAELVAGPDQGVGKVYGKSEAFTGPNALIDAMAWALKQEEELTAGWHRED